MFGYLRPLEDELKVKEDRLYRAVYCGICRAIKLRLGELPRLALQYDAVLPALFWLALSDRECALVRRRCVVRPIRVHPVAENHPALDTAAAVCILLAGRKLEDDSRDERRLIHTVGERALRLSVRKAQRALPPDCIRQVDDSLTDLIRLETCGSSSMDAVADCSGRMLGAIFTACAELESQEKEALHWIGYHTGRWVYLADCLQDYENDRSHGHYNVLAQGGMEKDAAFALAREACDYAAAQAVEWVGRLKLKRYRPLIENYYFGGMSYRLNHLEDKEQLNG